MAVVGVLTSDFRVYYEVVKALKERGIPFASLEWGRDVPPEVGVVITTDLEAIKVDFRNLVIFSSPQEAVDDALQALTGKRTFKELVIGIDPGDKPGIAVVGDGKVVRAYRAAAPSQVRDEVARITDRIFARAYVLRVGHGAATARDRIINALLDLGHAVEEVDETRTSPVRGKTAEERDIRRPSRTRGLGYSAAEQRDMEAARAIAFTRGFRVWSRRSVAPSPGELRDLQRKSRIASGGELTISRGLARDVAIGRLSLEEAVERQRGEPRRAPRERRPSTARPKHRRRN